MKKLVSATPILVILYVKVTAKLIVRIAKVDAKLLAKNYAKIVKVMYAYHLVKIIVRKVLLVKVLVN